MPTYTATDPETGAKASITADKPPSEADFKAEFAKAPRSATDLIKNLPDTVKAQLKTGDLTALMLPGVAPIAMAALRDHPDIAKALGIGAGIAAAPVLAPAGAGGLAVAGLMGLGGAAGGAGATAGSQLANQHMDPSQIAGSATEGALTGLGSAGGLVGGPPVLRAIAKKTLLPSIVAGSELIRSGNPVKAAIEAGGTFATQKGAEFGANALERLAIKAGLTVAPTANIPMGPVQGPVAPPVPAAPAPPVVPPGMSSSGIPSNVIPIRPGIVSQGVPGAAQAAQMASSASSAMAGPSAAPAPSGGLPSGPALEQQIVQWRQKLGYSPAQMAQSLNELYKIPKTAGKQMIDMVMKAYGLE